MLALLLATSAAFGIDATRVDVPPVLDGKLDDPQWALATPVTEFVQAAPTSGGAPPGETSVRILHDDKALYFGVKIDNARTPRYRWAPREDLNQDDQIGLFIDTFQEGYAGYVFYFNPLGIQQDLRVNSGRWNFFWDAVLEAKGTVTGTGWELEVAIPFWSLKYPAGSGVQEWSLILERIDIKDIRTYTFPPTERDTPALFAQGAKLRLEPPPRGSGLEIVPSLTMIQQGSKEPGESSMTWTGVSQPLQAFRPSLDLRFGITPNIGFTGTVNPDFSQVENDETPIELNQLFAFSFPERRPFFLDGADLFEDRPGLLYTRSIVEPIGGLKVGGKEGPISVGILHAIDRSPGPSVHERGTPGFDFPDIEGAWTSNTVARVTTEAGGGTVGVSFADKRVLRPKGNQEGDPAGVNDAVVIDTFLPLPRRWVVAGSTFASLTGDGLGPLKLGYGAETQIGRQSGIGTGGFVRGVAVSPDLRMETGFHPQSGYVETGAGLDHTFEPKFLDTFMPGAEGAFHVEDDGDLWYFAQADFEAHEGAHGFGGWAGGQGERYATAEVHGPMFGAWYWARPAQWLEMNPSVATQRTLDYERLDGAQQTSASLFLTLWPTRHIRFDSSVAFQWLKPDADVLERSTRLRGKLNYQFTRTLGARVIAEYAAGADVDDTLTGSLLLTWLLHPGTGVWVGYAETGTLAGNYSATERTAFVKASILIRPRAKRKA